jgi:hypothetical protein
MKQQVSTGFTYDRDGLYKITSRPMKNVNQYNSHGIAYVTTNAFDLTQIQPNRPVLKAVLFNK